MYSRQEATAVNWHGYTSRQELEASGILDKWAQQQQQQQQSAPRATAGRTAPQIQLCPRCQGHRIEKVPYNAMTLERTCSQCDGEGVIRSIPTEEATAPTLSQAGDHATPPSSPCTSATTA